MFDATRAVISSSGIVFPGKAKSARARGEVDGNAMLKLFDRQWKEKMNSYSGPCYTD